MAKNIVESAKNFKNVSLTVSQRQQMRMASTFYTGMFETNLYTILGKATSCKNVIEKGDVMDKIIEFLDGDDIVCEEILVSGQKYKKGDLLVLEVFLGGDTLKVGVVQMILVKGEQVFYAVREYVARKSELGFFVSMHVSAETKFVSKLADTKPLIMRGTMTKFQFVLHHYISFDYS